MVLIIILGIVSLFADVTYEGARSITGPFLAILGASGAAVGIIAGFGEFAGYGIRLLSGYMSDRMQKLWPFMFLGYFINLAAVPLLAFAGGWKTAAVLIILERIGRAIRAPARDTMLSYASKEMGHGKGFGIHQAFDQTGALIGPLIISLSLFEHEKYQTGFLFLGIPAVLALCFLFVAKFLYPKPEEFEAKTEPIETKGFPRFFWLYLVATGCIAAGYADFALIAYHFQKAKILSPVWIPLYYAMAMGIAGLAALLLGRLFDRRGFPVMLGALFAASLFAPFVFLGGAAFCLIGMVLWGLGLGAQGSILKAVIATLIHHGKRGSAYGLYGLSFGLFWFIGSAILGYLYDISLIGLVIFSIAAQWIALLLLFRSRGSIGP